VGRRYRLARPSSPAIFDGVDNDINPAFQIISNSQAHGSEQDPGLHPAAAWGTVAEDVAGLINRAGRRRA